jgi:hypothetical protein
MAALDAVAAEEAVEEDEASEASDLVAGEDDAE